ncbi:MAG: sugar phosphate isomerase/epimerase, partial [Planctomycetes bacterium]|nr:sugar phosphate isomerase/epimerase [Planctomycetota bacterium]
MALTKGTKNMDFAICLWDLDIEPAMQGQIFEGVSAIEPGAPVLSETDPDLLQAQAEILRGRNIEIYSAHAPFGPEHDLSSSDSEKRDGAVQSTLLALRNAALIGAQCVVLHPGPPVPTEQRSARWDNLRESIEHLLPKAEELEVTLALENLLPGYLGDQTISLRKFVDRFDSSLLGFCFDTGHAHLNDEGVMQAFEVLREDIINFHIQDNDGWMDRHIQPPYGTIDWDALAPELRSLDFEHP